MFPQFKVSTSEVIVAIELKTDYSLILMIASLVSSELSLYSCKLDSISLNDLMFVALENFNPAPLFPLKKKKNSDVAIVLLSV